MAGRRPAPRSVTGFANVSPIKGLIWCMPAFNVHEAKTQFSKLLDRVLEGETILITRNGTPVAELVPARRRPFPLGAGRHDSNINPKELRSDNWWLPMTEEEVEEFLDGRD